MAGFRWWHHRSRHCLEVLPAFISIRVSKGDTHVTSEAAMAQQA